MTIETTMPVSPTVDGELNEEATILASEAPHEHGDDCPECNGNGAIGGDTQSPWACTRSYTLGGYLR